MNITYMVDLSDIKAQTQFFQMNKQTNQNKSSRVYLVTIKNKGAVRIGV